MEVVSVGRHLLSVRWARFALARVSGLPKVLGERRFLIGKGGGGGEKKREGLSLG